MSIVERPRSATRPSGREPTPAEQPVEPKYEYPGIPTTCDGAEAVVHVEINVTPGVRRVPDHQLDHDGRRLQRRRA